MFSSSTGEYVLCVVCLMCSAGGVCVPSGWRAVSGGSVAWNRVNDT